MAVSRVFMRIVQEVLADEAMRWQPSITGLSYPALSAEYAGFRAGVGLSKQTVVLSGTRSGSILSTVVN